ncbi:MAG: hypothetical protein IT509_11445 [Rhodocyclaceae bacterium]|nr:hypothetical protein [Rhodocyclaceae bacterium]
MAVAPRWRFPILLLGFVSLFAGVVGGLARLGWPWGAALAAMHGPLMSSAFFGTVISLDRAVALGSRWAYAAPIATAAGGLAAMASIASPMPEAISVLGSTMMLAASIVVWLRQRELFILMLVLGAAAWAVGNALWLAGVPFYAIAPWWMAFFLLTIAGERLELSRLLPPSAVARRVFCALVTALLAGLMASLVIPQAGMRAFGAASTVIALWLLRQDVARRTVKTQGLTRFIAVCLLSGYVWLAIGGAVMLIAGLGSGGTTYDAALHAIMLGFVFSMVFGHAPIILPAVLRVAVPYHPYFYAPLFLLHASLALRFAADMAQQPQWRAWGGAANGLALLAFLLGTLGAVVRGSAARSASKEAPK